MGNQFSKWVFRIAGIYGLMVLIPQYFMEAKLGVDMPPAINHPEFFYGFIGVALIFQLVFLMISTNPGQYRLMMIPAILEKWIYTFSLLVLFAQARINTFVLTFGIIDFVWGGLFFISFIKSKRKN